MGLDGDYLLIVIRNQARYEQRHSTLHDRGAYRIQVPIQHMISSLKFKFLTKFNKTCMSNQWRTQRGAQGVGAPPSALAQQPVQ